jgi:AraC-like DNA-binding protein
MSNTLGSPFFSNNLIFNSDRSFQLSYFSNSPQQVVESVSQMPMAEHDKVRQVIRSNNPFFTGSLHYRETDNEQWILATEIVPHTDIVMRALYDQTKEASYYVLGFALIGYDFPFIEEADGSFSITKCMFYKPRTEAITFLDTGVINRFCGITFTRNWVEKNLVLHPETQKKEILRFLDNETGFLNRIDIAPAVEDLSAGIWQRLHSEETPGSDKQWFAETLHTIIRHFFQAMLAGKRTDYYPLFNKDYPKLALVEKHMLKGLMKPFAGVDAMAKIANMSPTKLKAVFKSVFGFSMLQYHKEKNLLLSRQLVQGSTTQIKKIAAIAGYKTVNKFSAAYKKRFGLLPGADRAAKRFK